VTLFVSHEHCAKKTSTDICIPPALAAQATRWSISQKYPRRDASQPRLSATDAATKEVTKKYFSDSPDWWSLELLVTDRDFRRRGAATKVLTWGTDQADVEDVFCGIEASPMGSKLYAANGFEKLDTWVVQVHGEEEKLVFDIMKRKRKGGLGPVSQPLNASIWSVLEHQLSILGIFVFHKYLC
jgi:hypothetical protein